MDVKRIGIVFAALIPVVIVGAFVFMPEEQASAPAPSTPAATDTTGMETIATETSGTETVTTESLAYENGTYTADGEYASPMGPEKVTVTMTVANDIVTDVSVATHGIGASALWQGKFASGIQKVAVGKSLGDLQVSNVSGSSLTPIGFNAAVEAIRVQAAM